MRTPDPSAAEEPPRHIESSPDKTPLLKRPPVRLAITGLISWWLYVRIVWLSRDFVYGSPGVDRPLLAVMAIFGGVFVLYLVQTGLVLWTGQSAPDIDQEHTHGVLPVIVVFAFAFRLLMLFSEPIQEVDAYRYLWDGQAVAAGVNPFRYSPQQVLDAEAESRLPPESSLRRSSECLLSGGHGEQPARLKQPTGSCMRF